MHINQQCCAIFQLVTHRIAKHPIKMRQKKNEYPTRLKKSEKKSLDIYEVKKNQRHTTNKKPNMYKDRTKDNQYFGLSNRPSSG